MRKTLADKPPLRLLADRIAQYFVPAILFLGLLTFALWYWVVEPGALDLAARYAISVLVIACPCALGLATPTALTVAVGESARRNILFAEATALETLPRVNAFLMDKTGTLTLGSPSVTELQWFIPKRSAQRSSRSSSLPSSTACTHWRKLSWRMARHRELRSAN